MSGKAYSTHHAQRVVAERYIGVKGRAYQLTVEVAYSVIGVDQLTEVVTVYAHCHGVYSEVTPRQVVVESAVLNYGFAAVMAV